MIAAGFVAVLTATILIWIMLPPLWRRYRHRRLAAQGLPARWRRNLHASLPLYAQIEPTLRRRLDARIAVFMASKRFHGCAGLELDEQMRLTIAGHACLLCLQPEAESFPAVRDILVYPDAFYVHHAVPDALGLVDDSPDLLAGEAWDAGRVVLSWQDVAAAVAGAEHNVVVHEFAHQLDYDNPQALGAPPLADYREWSQVFSAAFEALAHQGSPVLDIYGAQNPAEFFAVASEAYFQRGPELARHHPALYQTLLAFYRLDTAAIKALGQTPSAAEPAPSTAPD